MTRILRVFPRRTSYTPTDGMAFVGPPPLIRPDRSEVDEVRVSVAFTWDMPRAAMLRDAWAEQYPGVPVRLGGPAYPESYGDGSFKPGLYVKPGVTFTSRGCNNHCIAPESVVLLVDGSICAVKDIRPGDYIWGMDLLQQRPRPQAVTDVIASTTGESDIIIMEVVGGHRLVCTTDHPIWSRRGWVEAGCLTPNDEVLVSGQEYVHTPQKRYDAFRISESAPRVLREGKTDRGAVHAPSQRHDTFRILQGTSGAFASRASRSRPIPGEPGGQAVARGERAQIECRWHIGSERAYPTRGARRPRAADAGQQSDETTGGEGESPEGSSVTEAGVSCTYKSVTCGGQNGESSTSDSRATRGYAKAHVCEQPYEESRSPGEGCANPSESIRNRPQGYGGTVGQRGNCTQQGRDVVGGDDRAAGLSVCRRRTFLDRPLPEWQMPKPRFCIRDRPPENSHSAEWEVLAQPPQERRQPGNGGLRGARLAGVRGLGFGIESINAIESDQGLVNWARVTRISRLPSGSQTVFDLRTEPDHCFFAEGILVHNCPWCLVPSREGKLRELPIVPGNIVQDNALLQCSRGHVDAVFDMLKVQKRKAVFAGGLSPEELWRDEWFRCRLLELRPDTIFMAADTDYVTERWLFLAVNVLPGFTRRQLRCYMLCGFRDEEIGYARERLKLAWRAGVMPFAQLYQPADRWIVYGPEWKALAREWSRPAAMIAMHAEGAK